MGKRGFIAYDPILAREKFSADLVVAIYYQKLLRYDEILKKDTEGLFTASSRLIEKATCISSKQQDRTRTWLEKYGFIVTVLKIPDGKSSQQMHFRIVDEKRPL